MPDDANKPQTAPGAKPVGDETPNIPPEGSADDETRIRPPAGTADDETRIVEPEHETQIVPPEHDTQVVPPEHDTHVVAPEDETGEEVNPVAVTDPAAPVPELVVGSTFAGFELLAEIARGEMGIVYRAKRLSLDRIEALKVIAPRYAADPDFRARFRREAMNAAITRHPHIVDVYDADERDGHLFIAMQFVDGTDLRHRLQSGQPLSPDDAVEIARQVASALDAAHAGGVVHRDVKPGNILLTGEPGAWHAYLSDFGVSRRVSTADDLTLPGSVVGTPSYTAPEQHMGEPADRRSDVYSLGCVLFEMLTGHKPYRGDSVGAVAMAHVQQPIPGLDNVPSRVAASFDPVLTKALAKDPTERFASVGDLATAATAALVDSQRPEQEAEPPEPAAEPDPDAMATQPMPIRRDPEPAPPASAAEAASAIPPAEISQPPTQRQARPAAARSAPAALLGQVIALAGCIAVVLFVRLAHRYINFGNGMESLWDATRRGGDSSSTHTAADFRNLIIPVAVAFGLLTLSLFRFRRLLGLLAMLAGLLVVGQILRFRLGLGLGAHWQKPTAVGLAYWLSLGAAVAIVAGSALAVAVRPRPAAR